MLLIKRESFDEASSTIKVVACQGLNILRARVGWCSELLHAVQFVGRLPTPHLILCFTPPSPNVVSFFYGHFEGEASKDPVRPHAWVLRELIVPVDEHDMPVGIRLLEGNIMSNLYKHLFNASTTYSDIGSVCI